MSKETPQQQDMFSGELVDARSDYRKRQDRQRVKPQQLAMFSAQETVQIGVTPRPWLKDLPSPTLALAIQDARTDEEKERDWWRDAQKQIAHMFDGETETNDHEPEDQEPKTATISRVTQVVYDAPNLRQVGFRAAARRASIPVRSKR